jgi:hypothetical protein
VTKRAFTKVLRAAALLALLVCPALAHATPPGWREEKCRRYARDWEEGLARYGREGLSEAFVAGNESFLQAGCVAARAACPATPKDRRLADALALRVVNAGMSTTFLPFDCPSWHASP